MRTRLQRILSLPLLLAAVAFLAGCERPPVTSVQHGYRGLGMVEIYNPRTLDDKAAGNLVPAALPPVEPGAPAGDSVYKNIQVLKGLSVTEHMRQMTAFTLWVAPKSEGCAYCHDLADYSLDTKYTKVVARRMILLTQQVNADWKSHVASSGQPGAGVTCFTCHRGQPVPPSTWTADAGPRTAKGPLGNRAGQNYPTMKVGLTAMPFDPFTTFLTGDTEIRVGTQTALPSGNRQNIMQTEATYSLMMHLSDALGVNCTYCHNTRSFAAWDGSTPQRTNAWYGIRMVRQINTVHLEPLKGILPKARLGPQGDVPKTSCSTCHMGAYRPLNGALQLLDYPALAAPRPAATAVVAPAPPARKGGAKS